MNALRMISVTMGCLNLPYLSRIGGHVFTERRRCPQTVAQILLRSEGYSRKIRDSFESVPVDTRICKTLLVELRLSAKIGELITQHALLRVTHDILGGGFDSVKSGCLKQSAGSVFGHENLSVFD